jgi:uroporphyrin-III C-methyltransferase
MADTDPKASKSEAQEKSASEKKLTPESGSEKTQQSDNGTAKSKQKSNTTKKAKAKAKPSGRKAGGFFKFLFVVILLCGLSAAGWYLYQYIESELDSRDEQLQVTSQQVAELAQLIAASQLGQQNIERTLASFIGDQQRQMESLAERVRNAEGVRDGDWILAEAQYLLRLADQRLLISRDTESAAELLEAADDLLRELAYPELVAVREALISDVSALRASPSIDYQGLYFQILAAGRAIDSLALKGINVFGAEHESDGLTDSSGVFSSAVQSLKSTLAQLIIVRKTTDTAEWLVDTEGEAALRAQLDLLVLQALSALQSGDQTIYTSALNSIADILRANFEEGPQLDALQTSILEFADQPILAQVPDISASLRAMEYGAELLRRINPGE